MTNWKLRLRKLKDDRRKKYISIGILVSLFSLLLILDGVSTINVMVSIFGLIWIGTLVFRIITLSNLIKQINEIVRLEREKQNRQYQHFSSAFDDLDLNELLRELFEQFINQHQQQNHQRVHIHRVSQEKLSNAYKLLKLNRNDSIDKIKKTYKTLAIKWHPDKWATDSEENQAIASRNFKKLQSAYELIKKDKNII